VLVAGAGGFIGANLVRALLQAGFEAQALLRPGAGDHPRLTDLWSELAIAEADLRDRNATRRALSALRPRFVVNAVRVPHSGSLPDQVLGHVTTVANLIDAAIESGCERMVQLGSSLEYGAAPSPIDEEAQVQPNIPYGAAKAVASLLALSSGRLSAMAATVLRPFMVYGPWDREERLLQRALRAALEGSPLPMTEPGLARDWVFVGDVARACILALDGRADGEVVNLGTGIATSNERLVALVAEAVGHPVETLPGEIPARLWDEHRRYAATSKAREKLGWSGSVDVAEGVRRTAPWFQAHMPHEATLR
jgi:nucleoside-diphosphate-sugar epimerase